MTELSWFLDNVGERIYPVVNPQSHVEAKDGVYITSRKHAMRLYIEAREKGINYSNQKRWF